jgi:hypothetical protein
VPFGLDKGVDCYADTREAPTSTACAEAFAAEWHVRPAFFRNLTRIHRALHNICRKVTS